MDALSTQLTAEEYGRGFTRTNLFYMVQFAEAFPDQRIVHALSGQLSWTHFRQIVALDDSLKRDFYVEMCRIERWSTRALQRKIGTMLFERKLHDALRNARAALAARGLGSQLTAKERASR